MQGAHPWLAARFVVIGHEPSALETTVDELEAQGVQPAVMFERTRAIRALQMREPDVVVLDFGNQSGAPESLLGSLDQVRPLFPSGLHPAVVVLAEPGVVERIRQARVTSLHVAPHEDQEEIRAALTVALQESPAARLSGAAEAMTEPVLASSLSPPALTTGLRPRRVVLPGIAGLVLAAGGARHFAAQSDSRQTSGTPGLVSGAFVRQSTVSPPALTPPPDQPSAAGHMSATPSPTAPDPPTTARAAQREDGSGSLPVWECK
ncbi:MAG TPA: hypothetical protein VGW38_04885 [Chloroflexota bacterium]|nr:hypothetical protein [Chloroflexota bacterium]